MSIKMSIEPGIAWQFFNIMKEVVDEFRLRISKEGWYVTAVDPANVALVTIDLPKDDFTYYEFDAAGLDEITVGIDVKTVMDFLDEEEDGTVTFTFSGRHGRIISPERCQLDLRQGMFSREMLLPMPGSIRKAPDMRRPILKPDYMFDFNTRELCRIVTKAGKVSDNIRFGFRHCDMVLTADTVDVDGFKWTAISKAFHWQTLGGGAMDASSSVFSLDYLIVFIKTIYEGGIEHVWLHISDVQPLVIEFGLGVAGSCEYVVAPRTEL